MKRKIYYALAVPVMVLGVVALSGCDKTQDDENNAKKLPLGSVEEAPADVKATEETGAETKSGMEGICADYCDSATKKYAEISKSACDDLCDAAVKSCKEDEPNQYIEPESCINAQMLGGLMEKYPAVKADVEARMGTQQ